MAVTLDGFVKPSGEGSPKLVRIVHPLGPSNDKRDQSILLNWAEEYNRDTQEGANTVTVVQKATESDKSGKSFLLAKLGDGMSFSVSDFGDDCSLAGSVSNLDLTIGRATIDFATTGDGCPIPPTPAPTPVPPTAPPSPIPQTSEPTLAPSAPRTTPSPIYPPSVPPTPSLTTDQCPVVGTGVRITSCSFRPTSEYSKSESNFCPSGSYLCARRNGETMFAGGWEVTKSDSEKEDFSACPCLVPLLVLPTMHKLRLW